jgi:membrane protein
MRKLDVALLKDTFSRFGADNASTWAAAIAYSTVFAIAPLIIIAVAIAGSVLGLAEGRRGNQLEDQLIAQIGHAAGPQAASTVRTMVQMAFSSHQGSTIAQIAGWVTFILAASGLFMTLQGALNAVWRVDPSRQGIWVTVRNRVVSAGMLLALGFLLIVTTALNFIVSFFWTHFTELLPFPGASVVASILNYVVDIALIAAMFALMFRYLPDADVAWEDVKVGAIASAVLFVVGQALLSIYISHAGIANGYGAVGSLVVLLVWVYYSAMLLLLGAEFTRVYAERYGSLSRPSSPSTVPTQRGEERVPSRARAT